MHRNINNTKRIGDVYIHASQFITVESKHAIIAEVREERAPGSGALEAEQKR